MTTGIYLLLFKSPAWGWYVGKSKNIENRFQEHCLKLSQDSHTKKLQEAYNSCKRKPPELIILTKCHEDWLDILEKDLFGAVASYYARKSRAPYYSSLNHVILSEELNLPKIKKHINIQSLSIIVASTRPIHSGLLELT